jgi:hypothetical protein
MRKRSGFLSVLLTATLLIGVFVSALPISGADLGGLLKGAGIVFVVDQFADQLNTFINKVTLNKGVGVEDRTKVVPIISLGSGTYAGAAQISGPATAVETVKAVALLETAMSGNTFRIKALIPVASKNVVKDVKRVSGVGVSAIIDIKL